MKITTISDTHNQIYFSQFYHIFINMKHKEANEIFISKFNEKFPNFKMNEKLSSVVQFLNKYFFLKSLSKSSSKIIKKRFKKAEIFLKINKVLLILLKVIKINSLSKIFIPTMI